jgi:16S rRNA (guanine527-N7)-methyltransferase
MDLLLEGAKEWGLTLTPQEVETFALYYEQLVLWNERVNLTSITDYEGVQVKHFLDSLSCLRVLDTLSPDANCIDIGAGAGFPGLPLKIARARMRVTLLESVRKKVAFLEHVVEELGLRSVEVVRERAEDLARQPAHRERYDVAVGRAVAQMATLAEYGLPLVRLGGILLAQKGTQIEGEVESALPAIELVGGRLREVQTVFLPGLSDPRHLVVVEKVAPTPNKYPRRTGMPGKRPLGLT